MYPSIFPFLSLSIDIYIFVELDCWCFSFLSGATQAIPIGQRPYTHYVIMTQLRTRNQTTGYEVRLLQLETHKEWMSLLSIFHIHVRRHSVFVTNLSLRMSGSRT